MNELVNIYHKPFSQTFRALQKVFKSNFSAFFFSVIIYVQLILVKNYLIEVKVSRIALKKSFEFSLLFQFD